MPDLDFEVLTGVLGMSFIDIFLLTIGVFLVYKLLLSKLISERGNSKKREVEELQLALSNLIKEAVASGKELNDSLAIRKNELEKLIGDLDLAQYNAEKVLGRFNSKISNFDSLQRQTRVEAEFPNESWIQPRKPKALQELAPAIKNDVPEFQDEKQLEQFAVRMGVEVPAVIVAKRLLEEGKKVNEIARKIGATSSDVMQIAHSFGIAVTNEQPISSLSSQLEVANANKNSLASTKAVTPYNLTGNYSQSSPNIDLGEEFSG